MTEEKESAREGVWERPALRVQFGVEVAVFPRGTPERCLLSLRSISLGRWCPIARRSRDRHITLKTRAPRGVGRGKVLRGERSATGPCGKLLLSVNLISPPHSTTVIFHFKGLCVIPVPCKILLYSEPVSCH